MSTFSVNIIQVLEEYKGILRSFLPLKEANARIHRLGLVNKKMLCANDTILYKIANKTIDDLQAFINNFAHDSLWRVKLQDYLERLQKTLQAFCVEGDRVINVQQEASRLALEVIQILSLPPEKITENVRQKMQFAMQKIHQYGASEQYQQLEALIEKSGWHNQTVL